MSMMMRRKMMVRAARWLPAEYQRVEYLQSVGGKTYINTGVIPNSSMRVVVDAESPNVSAASFTFGSRKSTSSERFWIVTWNGYVKHGFGSNHNINIKAISSSTRYTADFNHTSSHTMTVDDTSIDAPETTGTYTYPIFLFAINNGGNADLSQHRAIKVYSFKIFNSYQDTTPILNFIPCYRKSDNKPGMYDTVSRTFYTNSGTGEFVVGPDTGPNLLPSMDTWYFRQSKGTIAIDELGRMVFTTTSTSGYNLRALPQHLSVTYASMYNKRFRQTIVVDSISIGAGDIGVSASPAFFSIANPTSASRRTYSIPLGYTITEPGEYTQDFVCNIENLKSAEAPDEFSIENLLGYSIVLNAKSGSTAVISKIEVREIL